MAAITKFSITGAIRIVSRVLSNIYSMEWLGFSNDLIYSGWDGFGIGLGLIPSKTGVANTPKVTSKTTTTEEIFAKTPTKTAFKVSEK